MIKKRSTLLDDLLGKETKTKRTYKPKPKPELGDIDLTPLANKLNQRDRDFRNRIAGLTKSYEDIFKLTNQVARLTKDVQALQGRMNKVSGLKKMFDSLLKRVGLKPKSVNDE